MVAQAKLKQMNTTIFRITLNVFRFNYMDINFVVATLAKEYA